MRQAITIKIWQNNKMIAYTTKYMKNRILRIAQVKPWTKAYLKVSYGNGFYNDAYCCDFEDLQKTLSFFTERSLLDFLL